MRRHGNLWHKIISLDNLYEAYRAARRGKRWQKKVQRFERNTIGSLLQLQIELDTQRFTTSPYRTKKVYEPKERDIFILPFYPDRIVQHALLQVLTPIWDPMFIEHSYACRPGRGMHMASKKAMEHVRGHRYFLKADISKFYPSIDHVILKAIVRKKIKCAKTLRLVDDIIDSFEGGKNTPIGNYTSQWFGNLYLNELDRWLIDEKKVRAYVRYNDDFILFDDDKAALRKLMQDIEVFLRDRLKLRYSKAKVAPVTAGLDFVGYRHFRSHILLRKSTATRVKRRLKRLPLKLAEKRLSLEQYRSSIASTEGWLKWANTYNLKQSLELEQLKHYERISEDYRHTA
jgi:RNA-directed DNA polymerase